MNNLMNNKLILENNNNFSIFEDENNTLQETKKNTKEIKKEVKEKVLLF